MYMYTSFQIKYWPCPQATPSILMMHCITHKNHWSPYDYNNSYTSKGERSRAELSLVNLYMYLPEQTSMIANAARSIALIPMRLEKSKAP